MKTIASVSIAINVDSVDLKFDDIVALEGLYIGMQDLRWYSIGLHDAQEARLDESASLVVLFVHTLQEPMPLFGKIDTGSAVSILSLNAFHFPAFTEPVTIQRYAANRKSINTIAIAEDVSSHLAGPTLKTNFVVIADRIGSEDYLFGRNFLRTHNVLVDLTAIRAIIRGPKKHRLFKAVHEVSDQRTSFVFSA